MISQLHQRLSRPMSAKEESILYGQQAQACYKLFGTEDKPKHCGADSDLPSGVNFNNTCCTPNWAYISAKLTLAGQLLSKCVSIDNFM